MASEFDELLAEGLDFFRQVFDHLGSSAFFCRPE
jgi:hypothetical protein